MIEISLTGDVARLAALPDQVAQLAQRLPSVAAEQYTLEIMDWIDAGRSFTTRTGQLEQSIGWRPESGGAIVFANAEHAGYIEGGTRHHVILPVRRKALKIPVSGGAGYIIRRSVNHPGTQPMPFFFADMTNRINTLTEVLLSEMTAEIGQ